MTIDPLKKFGPIWGASGIQGFFGEGYDYHKYAKLLGLNFKGLTFTAKTTTLKTNAGNMPFNINDFKPKELFPKCIYVTAKSWRKESALNAVGLSGPGIKALIDKNEWQKRKDPFFISIMPIQTDMIGRAGEISMFCNRIEELLDQNIHLRKLVGIQINYSCPNTGHDMEEMLEKLVKEASHNLSMLSTLEVPLVPKINILLPVEKALEIGNNPNCAGLTLSNTIPWNDLPKLGIDRKKIFGSEVSPLLDRGFKQAGGYSGRELLLHVAQYVQKLRSRGFTKHINAGGGIIYNSDLLVLHHVGADSFSIGSVAFLRPWNTGSIIRKAYELKEITFPN